jgi:hypothetical protein
MALNNMEFHHAQIHYGISLWNSTTDLGNSEFRVGFKQEVYRKNAQRDRKPLAANAVPILIKLVGVR